MFTNLARGACITKEKPMRYLMPKHETWNATGPEDGMTSANARRRTGKTCGITEYVVLSGKSHE